MKIRFIDNYVIVDGKPSSLKYVRPPWKNCKGSISSIICPTKMGDAFQWKPIFKPKDPVPNSVAKIFVKMFLSQNPFLIKPYEILR